MIPSEKRYEAILFDFDGTLLDSFPSHYHAYEVTLAHFNMTITPQRYMETYSPNWFAMYEALGIAEEKYGEADDIWLAEVKKHKPALFPTARPLLDSLSETYLLGLVTSGSRERVMRDLNTTGIRDFFKVIVTGDDIIKPKPDPEGLQIALERLGRHPSQVLFVGDAREDCRMAQAAGVAFVGISNEFATVSDVEDCFKLNGLDELGPYIAQSS
jgi:HAD superfamily hydrolase (TIGR01509 family)